MYAIKSTSDAQVLIANQLPCQIRHNGPVPVNNRYWSPVAGKTGSQTVYFRGRKLEGKSVRIPDGYEGVVLQRTDELLESETRREDEDDETAQLETKLFTKQACFDEILVWDHEALPASDDACVKGVEEWINFAEAMHRPVQSVGMT